MRRGENQARCVSGSDVEVSSSSESNMETLALTIFVFSLTTLLQCRSSAPQGVLAAGDSHACALSADGKGT